MEDRRERETETDQFFFYIECIPNRATLTSRPWSCPPQPSDAHSDEMLLASSLPKGFIQDKDP